MPSPARAPEQIIRDWLEQNGATRVGLDALEQTWGIDRLQSADRRRIADALDRVGVDVDPPLQRVSRSERLSLSVREAEPDRQAYVQAPDVEGAPAAASDEAAEPPSPAPPDHAPRPRGRRRIRRAQSLLNRATPPAPTPTSTAREDALRADAAREQARVEREQERQRVRAEMAERSEREREEREREEREQVEAQERDALEQERIEQEARASEEREREQSSAEAEYRRERERARAEAAEREAEAERDAEAAAVPAAPAQPISRAALGVAAVGLALMVLGSLGPWAKAVFVTDYGIDRSGIPVIGAAVVAAALLFLHVRRGRESWLPLVIAALGAFAAALVAGDYRELVDDSFVSPTWGLYAAFLGSVVLVCLSMSLLVRRRGPLEQPRNETPSS